MAVRILRSKGVISYIFDQTSPTNSKSEFTPVFDLAASLSCGCLLSFNSDESYLRPRKTNLCFNRSQVTEKIEKRPNSTLYPVPRLSSRLILINIHIIHISYILYIQSDHPFLRFKIHSALKRISF